MGRISIYHMSAKVR